MTTTVKGIHHVGLSVTDLDRSLTFYRAATGLDATFPGDGGGDRATLQGPSCRLELTRSPAARQPTEDMPVEGPGITHVCYQSSTADDIYGHFVRAGATPVSRGTEPVDLGGYGVYYAYARDPDGIMFEVEHLDRPGFDGDLWIAHVALASQDLDRLVDFYQLLLGTGPARRNDLIEGPEFDAVAGIDGVRIRAAWFDVGDMILELWQYLHPVPRTPTAPPIERIGYNLIAFEVDDLEQEYRRLVEAGVESVGPPTEGDGYDEVLARDPDGNPISLRQLRAD